MITVQIVSFKNSARFVLKRARKTKIWLKKCQKKWIKWNKNKNFAKAKSRLRGQTEANQPPYYTSILIITRTKAQK